MPKVIITIPAYNEERSIGKVIKDINKVMDGQDYIVQVVSDGSTDNTELEAKKAGATVFYKPHSGRADSFRYSMNIATSSNPDIIVTTDSDGQYTAEDIPRLLEVVLEGNDLALGSRLKGNIEYMPKSKKLLNILATTIIRYWLNRNITDVTTGLRAFNCKVAKLPIKSNYTFTTEQLVRTTRAGYKIKSIPITFLKRNDGDSRLMNSSIQYIWKTILDFRNIFLP